MSSLFIERPLHQVDKKFSFFNSLKLESHKNLSNLKLPTLKDEKWRFFDVSSLDKIKYEDNNFFDITSQEIQSSLSKISTYKVFNINGKVDSKLSTLVDNEKIFIGNLEEINLKYPDLLKEYLDNLSKDKDFFYYLNSAFMKDLSVIFIKKNAVIDHPIYLNNIINGEFVNVHPRTLVIAEEGSSSLIIEDNSQKSADKSFSNLVSEFLICKNANMKHINLYRHNETVSSISNINVNLERDSLYSAWIFSTGSKILRNNIFLNLNDEGAECNLAGLCVISNKQTHDTHSYINHCTPNSVSNQIHKAIVDDHAHSIFNGQINVKEGSYNTNANQQTKNLLLQKTSKVDAKPELIINNDDVKCSHGATIGQIEFEELFYLKSRGISSDVAKKILLYAFANEIIEQVPNKTIKSNLKEIILAKLN